MTRRWVVALGSLCLTVVMCAGCVGPAPTTEDYAVKAEQTASDAVSAARTAVLAVRTQESDRLTAAMLEVLLQESEAALSSVTGSFDALQPPNTPAADQVASQLNALLADAGDDARELRISARRDDEEQLRLHADALAVTADELEALAQELGQ